MYLPWVIFLSVLAGIALTGGYWIYDRRSDRKWAKKHALDDLKKAGYLMVGDEYMNLVMTSPTQGVLTYSVGVSTVQWVIERLPSQESEGYHYWPFIKTPRGGRKFVNTRTFADMVHGTVKISDDAQAAAGRGMPAVSVAPDPHLGGMSN